MSRRLIQRLSTHSPVSSEARERRRPKSLTKPLNWAIVPAVGRCRSPEEEIGGNRKSCVLRIRETEEKMPGSLGRLARKSLGFFYRKAETILTWWKYRGFKPDHVFRIDVDGVEFRMSFADYKLRGAIVERIEGRRERETVAVIKSIVRKGSKVLELGGCYGYFTILMSKCAGDTGKVVSVEGTPNNYKILCNNLALNGISNVATYNVFLTGISDVATFATDDHNPYDAIGRMKSSSADAEVEVKTVQYAPFLNEIGFEPDCVFMDIEGFEVEVFESMSDSGLGQNRPVIVFEIHETFYQEGKGLDYITGILDSLDYTYRRIGDNLICFPRCAAAA
jgi:FkbM family methyltransferase